MDQFIVSARKYRPASFDSVVGQNHISETLKNAIKSNHLAQAFLFSGPRGVGKTTCARILAKTINCFERTANIEACENCDSCKSFNEGHSLNIYELDAASNNSVDDIRALIEQVRFAPQIGTKKVYIIDEVHMLSAQAFNAFLKTLEEPPSHAIFILATTEKHKIIPTILSRCQIFDFNRIDLEDMVRQLADIAEKEEVNAEHDALHIIAQKSDGSLRDALSMFDQMVTYSGSDLTYQAVIQSLSILDTDYFFDITDYLVQQDLSSCLLMFDKILHNGFDGHNFLLGLAEHMRNLLVAQDHSTLELLTAGPIIKEKYSAQTLNVTANFLIQALNVISKSDMSYKASKNQRLLVELCLMNLSTLSSGGNSQKKPVANASSEEVKKKPIESAPVVSAKIPTTPPAEVTPKASVENITEDKPTIPEEKSAEKIEARAEQIKQVIEKKELVEKKEEGLKKPSDNTDFLSERETERERERETERETEGGSEGGNEAVAVKAETVVKESAPKPKKSYRDDLVTDSISISSFTNLTAEEIKEEASEENRVIKNTEPVTESKLSETWKRLLAQFDQKGKLSLHATLSKYPPSVVDDTHIKIIYDNKSQYEAIIIEKANMLEYLRNELKNDLLQLKLSISENQHQRAYTDSEKLDKLIEKNPNINYLRDELDLDLN